MITNGNEMCILNVQLIKFFTMYMYDFHTQIINRSLLINTNFLQLRSDTKALSIISYQNDIVWL